MPKECAFCPHTGKLSLEHIISDWVNPLFPGKKLFTAKNQAGQVIRQQTNKKIDWTAKLVCKSCNETWMNDIENQHAKPIMTDLIVGKTNIPIRQSGARSIALFAFKTAVILDHSQRGRQPFFSRRVRYAFREHLDIPRTLQMWMAGYAPRARADIHTSYHQGALSPTNPLELYVCTYAIGHFVFQLVARKQIGSTAFSPRSGFEDIAVPLWPRVHPGFVWPATNVLRTVKEFDAFSMRWLDVLPAARG